MELKIKAIPKVITLTNSFHHTKCKVLNIWGVETAVEAWIELQADAARVKYDMPARFRLKIVSGKLCGIKGCTCGTFRP